MFQIYNILVYKLTHSDCMKLGSTVYLVVFSVKFYRDLSHVTCLQILSWKLGILIKLFCFSALMFEAICNSIPEDHLILKTEVFS